MMSNRMQLALVCSATLILALTLTSAYAQEDKWKGPYDGHWSDPGNWTNGLPEFDYDVKIATDIHSFAEVILDTSSTINSLGLGNCCPSPYPAVLKDDGNNETLTVISNIDIYASGDLQLNNHASLKGDFGLGGNNLSGNNRGTIELFGYSTASFKYLNNIGDAQGAGSIYVWGNSKLDVSATFTNTSYVNFLGSGTTSNIGILVNGQGGYFGVGSGATVNLTNTPNGITDILEGSRFDIHGTFTAGSNSAFYQLNSIEGELDLYNGQTTNISSDMLTNASSGTFKIGGGSTVNIAGTLVNNGSVTVDPGATLNLTNQPDGITDIVAGSKFDIYGTFTAGSNSAFAKLAMVEGTLILENEKLTNNQDLVILGGNVTAAGLVNNKSIEVNSTDPKKPSTLTVKGDVDNSGTIYVENGSALKVVNGNGGDFHNFGTLSTLGSGNTVTINGTLTNNSGGVFALHGFKDTATTGDVENSGTISVENGSALAVVNGNGNFHNVGTLSTFGNDTTGSTVTIAHRMANDAGAAVNLYGVLDTLKAGSIVNRGSINVMNGSALSTQTLINGGYVSVDSLSKIVVGMGSPSGPGYHQLANGFLSEIITPSSWGVIDVKGSALLQGTLTILLQQGFNPPVGSLYAFLLTDPKQLSGTFSNIVGDEFNEGREHWKVHYHYFDGSVELEAVVTEPGTLLVLIPGLLGAGYGLRRKLLA